MPISGSAFIDKYVLYSCSQSSSLLLVNYHFVAWLADEMKVRVQFYDDKPLSASVPKRVTCIVKEVISATTRYVSLFIVVLNESSLFLFAIFSNFICQFFFFNLSYYPYFFLDHFFLLVRYCLDIV